MGKDYYKILGVPRNVSEEELKKAYKRLVIKYHPDKTDTPGAEERFKEASEAYDVLSDPKKRSEYDHFGKVSGSTAGTHARTVQDIMGSSFYDFFSNTRGRAPHARAQTSRPGNSLRVTLSIDLKDILHEQKRTLLFRRGEVCEVCAGTKVRPGATTKPCPVCKGRGAIITEANHIRMQMPCHNCQTTGKIIEDPCLHCLGRGQVEEEATVEVTIPKGVENGTRLRVPRQGSPGEHGGPRGDLFIDIVIRPHPNIDRQGDRLLTTYTISFAEAALGTKINIKGLDQTLELEIPAGTQPGDRLRISGHGVPSLNSSKRGDLIIQIIVKIPKKLNAKQKELIREFTKGEEEAQ